ncbi:protocadherin-23-like [Erythrolamprus reginae]|uniref:protocadherin-23-like n=1 Tax=Erythrolamprus reginae TaxID=121349 RepID=UPI00396C63D0
MELALKTRKRWRKTRGRPIGRWPIPLWLCLLCIAGECSAQVYKLSLQVEEELPADTLVGDISAGLPPGEAHPAGFFFSEGSGESALFADFHVHPDTGLIVTARPLDRERTARYSFAAATPSGAIVQVEIAVVDVNDHAPSFPRESARLSVSELSPPGSAFRLPAARDLDEGSFGIWGYSLLPDGSAEEEENPFFRVRYGAPSDPLDLLLLRRLDREQAATHQLLIEAWDGGSPRRSGRLRVEIYVLDENDNAPTFGQREYRARLREDAPAGMSVCRVFATDPDLGVNGEVRYALSRRQGDSSAPAYFEVGERSGLLRLRRPLDRELRASHHLAVEARDGGAQPEMATAWVSVEVLDVNDNPPVIQLLYLTEAGAGVSEGARAGDYVARVSVSDPDQQPFDGGGGVTLSLEGGEGAFSLRRGDGGVYFLCVEGPLDRETREAYELRLTAVDAGVPPLSSRRLLALRVADLNDEAPAFAQPRYRATVSEAALPGAVVLRLSASDADEPSSRNSQVRYALAPFQPHGALFRLDPLSGLLSLRAALDREREALVQLWALARDLGAPPLSASCLVSVAVADANDNEPVFERQVYNVSLGEHSEVGHCLLQVITAAICYEKVVVKAMDQDSGHFGFIEYFLYTGFHSNEKSEAFQIDINSGCIYVSQDIDREKGPSTYDFLVKAVDGGGLSAQAFVHIVIEDINDNLPIFNPVIYLIDISSHTQPGTEITKLLATDKDSGIYGAVTYKLIPGHFSSLFKVDPSTGTVYLISALTNTDCSSVRLTVSAQDGGGLSSDVDADVTLRTFQTAVAPAVFEHSFYSFSITEDAPEGSSVGTVKARKPLSFLDTVSYRISSGNSHRIFTIDSHSGNIHTRKQLDRETHNHILLTVQSQLGSSSIFSSAQVNITLIDINDNYPVFMIEYDQIYISQSTLPGTALYIARAEDNDSGLNGLIRYAIVNSQSSIFTIDPALGILYLIRDLSGHKQHENVVVHIRAEDHGNPTLSSVLILGVLIDKQKRSPLVLTFEKLLYQVEVSEGSCLGATIVQIRALKLNPHHIPATLTYSLEHNIDSVSFKIDPETGVVYLRNPLDYEHLQTYSFRAFVSSSMDKSVQNASTLIIINVMDENDNSPVFLHGDYFIEVEERVLPQGVIGTIKAIDKDSGRNGQLSYFILSNENDFRINSNTGEIINWEALDYEQQVQHHLIALVTDHGVPQLNATTSVYISVMDLNDNRPCFSQDLLHFKVLERQPAGTRVASIFAKDLDSGNNGLVLYSLSSEESLGHFQIDSSSGELTTTKALLYNWYSNYRMVITAIDKGNPSLQGETVINIEVISLGKGISYSSQYIRHFAIPEDFRPAQVMRSLKLPDQHLYANRKQHFIIPEEDSDIPFEIDNATGDLFLSKALDYEAISHYSFRVVVTDSLNISPHNETVFLSIDVEDQNDHSPSFQNNFIVIGIQENMSIGTLVYTFSARDEDGTFSNRNFQYSMHSNYLTENSFFIHPIYGTLITAVSFDREITPFFVLTILASDQAVNPTEHNQCSLTAKIVILDANDNSPSFVSSPISYIREDAEVGTIAHHIIAHDPDQGMNGQVTYLLSSNEDQAFLIDKTTGVLTTVFALDRENQEYYNLKVVALDNGNPALSAIQNLTVIVLDVNDEAPIFTKAIYEASVWENRAPGMLGIKVEAVDKDSGINSLLKYEILPGPAYENFQINSNTGEIRTAASLDRESQDIFHIKVLVQDGGTPCLSSTASIIFRVLDENDHTPKIIFPFSDIQILENQLPSTITTLLAMDDDIANNGIMQYQIIGGNTGGYFALHKSTGDLFTTCSLDRERVNNFTLVIECFDLGNPPRSSVMELQIIVLDENDNSPLFTRNPYKAIISEDIEEKSSILELFAVDADEGPNGKIVYTLMDETLGMFTINRTSGVVSTNKPMDRERQSQYIFKAVATDSDVWQPRSASVTIVVQIEDVNDNNPFFLEHPLNVQVSSQTPINQAIATVQSRDLDLGLNGTLKFRFVTPATMFEMDSSTGEIFLKESVSNDGLFTHLVIVACDQGIPARTATGVVTISSKAYREMIYFSHTRYEAVIPENSEVGTSVFTVAAHDKSMMENNIKYTIISEHEDIFDIHPISGEITVKRTEFLDYEIRKEVHFSVVAENGMASAVCGVTVFLQDINDNAPQFEQSYIRASVWEGQVYVAYITQIYATDSDSGRNGEIEYSILFGNINEVFLIDSTRGIISTNMALDRENISLYRFELVKILHARQGKLKSLDSGFSDNSSLFSNYVQIQQLLA